MDFREGDLIISSQPIDDKHIRVEISLSASGQTRLYRQLEQLAEEINNGQELERWYARHHGDD